MTQLNFRRLVRREALSEGQREALEGEIANMNAYREQEELKAAELHVTDMRTEEEKLQGAELATEMLKIFPMPPLIAADGRQYLST